MDCATFKESVGALAFGTLSNEERALVEAHLAQPDHDGCIEALERAFDGVAAIGGTIPPPRVWTNIERGLGLPTRQARRSSQLGWAAAAAMALVALGLALRPRGVATLTNELHTTRAELHAAVAQRDEGETAVRECRARLQAAEQNAAARAEAVALLELAGTRLVALPAQAGQVAQANAILHTGLKRAFVVAEGLRPIAAHDYELWVARGKKVVAAGVLRVDGTGRSVARIDYASLLGGTEPPDAIMVTLEATGGSTVVNGPTVVLGKLHG